MSWLLSEDELIEFTGLKQPKKQIQFFSKNNIPFEINALGRPKVLREAIENRINSKSKPNKAKKSPKLVNTGGGTYG